YLNFIPYFAVLFMPLFTFVAVIYFTSRMAYNTEIVAILSSGVSFDRLLRPYFISATIIAILSFLLNNFVIPDSTKEMLAFEELYYRNKPATFSKVNVHRQIEPGVIIYLESYNTYNNYGRKFSIEKFENGRLVSKLLSDDIRWDTVKNKWIVRNYYIRDYEGANQTITKGHTIDTTLNITPEEFKLRDNAIQAMDLKELNEYIASQKMQGSSNIKLSLIEKYKRFSVPFSTFILTIIGVSVSSRKAKGGIGMHIGIGLMLSFAYILFMQFSTQFAIGGVFNPFIAVWIPNIIFAFIAFLLYRIAPK
ncbi:MAG: LptF/LptG family permease, partial [Bacteroidales bacterium]|nr:LptF/LptG family permease [Bacteroidales bacterium]